MMRRHSPNDGPDAVLEGCDERPFHIGIGFTKEPNQDDLADFRGRFCVRNKPFGRVDLKRRKSVLGGGASREEQGGGEQKTRCFAVI